MLTRLPGITVLESRSWERPSKVWFPTPDNMSCCHLSLCPWIPGVIMRAAHITCCKQERSGELCLRTWILEPNCLDPTPDLEGGGREGLRIRPWDKDSRASTVRGEGK